MDSIEHVVTLVRTLMRERSVDPLTDVEAVRTLVDQVVDDFLVACADGTASMPAHPPSRDELVANVWDSVAGFGPLQRFLDDPEVEEIWINDPTRVFVARNGRSELTSTVLSESVVRDLVERMLSSSGRRLDLSSPFVDAALPDGSRLHVAIPDITRRHWAVNLRKHVCAARELNDLVRLGTMPSQVAEFLSAAVVAGLNILVAGGTQAGKTTVRFCTHGDQGSYLRENQRRARRGHRRSRPTNSGLHPTVPRAGLDRCHYVHR